MILGSVLKATARVVGASLVLWALCGAVRAQESEDCLLCHGDPEMTLDLGGRAAALYFDEERAALGRLAGPEQGLGLTDLLRRHHADAGIYSWWDYRGLAFQKRAGLRIDLILATPSLAARSRDCVVDKDARRGKGTSDHAPVVATLDD